MKQFKLLLSTLLIACLFFGFTKKQEAENGLLCGPLLYVNNYGYVTMTYAAVDNGYTDQEIMDLVPPTSYYTGQWGGGTGTFSFKMIITGGQNGSIKVYENSYYNMILCEPTYVNTDVYRFDFPITGCNVYIVEITTDPC